MLYGLTSSSAYQLVAATITRQQRAFCEPNREFHGREVGPGGERVRRGIFRPQTIGAWITGKEILI